MKQYICPHIQSQFLFRVLQFSARPRLYLSSSLEEEHDIYDISYCYIGIIALVISMIVSAVVALVTG